MVARPVGAGEPWYVVKARPQNRDVNFLDLTEPEQLLWDAFPRGAWVDLRAEGTCGNDPGDAGGWVKRGSSGQM